MRPKWIITDLDGALLHSDKSLSPYTVEVFRACMARGIGIAIATARYRISAEAYIQALRPDFSLTTQGTMTYEGGALAGYPLHSGGNPRNRGGYTPHGADAFMAAATRSAIYHN